VTPLVQEEIKQGIKINLSGKSKHVNYYKELRPTSDCLSKGKFSGGWASPPRPDVNRIRSL
jgi:hypothetical protein